MYHLQIIVRTDGGIMVGDLDWLPQMRSCVQMFPDPDVLLTDTSFKAWMKMFVALIICSISVYTDHSPGPSVIICSL